jgi:hypothetical protein
MSTQAAHVSKVNETSVQETIAVGQTWRRNHDGTTWRITVQHTAEDFSFQSMTDRQRGRGYGSYIRQNYQRFEAPNAPAVAPIIARANAWSPNTPVDALAVTLMKAWGSAEPDSEAAKHPASYVTSFVDMARAAIEAGWQQETDGKQ